MYISMPLYIYVRACTQLMTKRMYMRIQYTRPVHGDMRTCTHLFVHISIQVEKLISQDLYITLSTI